MARSVSADTVEVPKFIVSARYSVNRLGEFPSAAVTLMECVYILDPCVIDSVSGRDVFVSSLADNESLVGRVVSLPNSTPVGVVAVSERVAVPGSDPASYTRQITLAADPLVEVSPGQSIGIARMTPVGAPAYRRAASGRTWEITVDSHLSDGLARLEIMMGTIGFSMLKAGLQALGVTKTDEEIMAAIQTLAAQGVNIDSFFGDQGDQLELDRLAGTVPWAAVLGNAPTT